MVVGASLSLAVRRTLDPVQGIHRAVSGRWFARLGPVARPIERWHDAVAGLVYGSIRVGADLAGRGIDASRNPQAGAGVGVQAVMCGLWGDDLGGDAARLDQPMVLLGPGPAGAPDPGRPTRVAILLHGLMQTERCWNRTGDRPGLVQVLGDRTDITPVTVRYNTGRSIADNGAQLAAVLELWLLGRHDIASVDLIGHSMGGLVARATVEQGAALGHGWTDRLGQVITLGTPHGGAPIAKGLHALGQALRVAESSRPLAEFLDRRSAGIKDLRHGRISPPGRSSSTTAAVDQRFVAGLVTPDPRHPAGWLAGDLLVRRHSAEGGDIAASETALVTGTTHRALLDHPHVVDRIVGWLEPRSATTASS